MARTHFLSRPVIICAGAALFLFACAKDEISPVDVELQAFDDLRTEISASIDDPTREAEAIRLVNELQEDIAALRTTVESRKNKARALNANYDVTREEFEAFIAEIEAEILQNKSEVSKTHRAFLEAITFEERAAIAQSHTSVMKAAIAAIQKI